MKSDLFGFGVILSVLVLTGCGKQTHLDVGQNFLDEFCQFDEADIRDFTTDSYGKRMAERIIRIKADQQNEPDPLINCTYQITKEESDGVNANLNYTIDYHYQSGKVKNGGGQWYNRISLKFDVDSGWQVNGFN